MPPASVLRSIRVWLAIVILGLFISGITAFPLQHELDLVVRITAHFNLAEHAPALNDWFLRVDHALADTNARYPFLAYGTDWLAFAHLVIAIAFIGPYRDPVRNKSARHAAAPISIRATVRGNMNTCRGRNPGSS